MRVMGACDPHTRRAWFQVSERPASPEVRGGKTLRGPVPIPDFDGRTLKLARYVAQWAHRGPVLRSSGKDEALEKQNEMICNVLNHSGAG